MKLLEMTPLKSNEDWELYFRMNNDEIDLLIETKEQGQRYVNEETVLVMKVSEQINSSQKIKHAVQEMIPMEADKESDDEMPVRKRKNNRSRRNSLRRK